MSSNKVLKLLKDKEIEFVDLRFTDPGQRRLLDGCVFFEERGFPCTPFCNPLSKIF